MAVKGGASDIHIKAGLPPIFRVDGSLLPLRDASRLSPEDIGLNIIDKAGSWYSYGDERLGQGRENSKQTLKDNPDMMLEIENQIREHYGLPVATKADLDLGGDEQSA